METKLAEAILELDTLQLSHLLETLKFKNKEAYEDLKEIVEDL